MAITKTDFNNINKDDISDLVQGEFPESINLEYKEQTYENTDNAKKELSKDISAFANTNGGNLIIGIKEKKGIPIKVCGMKNIEIDNEILRLDQIIRSGIEPPLVGVKINPVQIENDNNVIVIRVPQSWSIPHRVSKDKHNKFYIRSSTGVNETSIDELRELFTRGSTLNSQIKTFQNDRLRLINDGDSPARYKTREGRIILHIVPFSAFRSSNNLDVTDIHNHRDYFRLIREKDKSCGDFRYNLDGFLVHSHQITPRNQRGEYGDICSYTQIFRNGIVEAVSYNILEEAISSIERQHCIAGELLRKDVVNAIQSYMDGLNILGISPPLAVLIALQGVEDNKIAWRDVENNYNYNNLSACTPLPKDEIKLPEVIIDEYGNLQYYQKKLKPSYDVLWNATGEPKAPSFDDTTF